ncbi:MAG TPA: CRTAC1 family protein [Thermoanaerobaculia bacterium]|nr:CRTAC1 family protein [Thermoanaerobaculia bacterium]
MRRSAVLPLAPLLLVLTAASSVENDAAPELFVDAAAASGLDFVHFNGMSGELYFTEMMGSGGALFDYDGDGDLDVYLVQGAMLGAGKTAAQATAPLRGCLYRNDLRVAADGARTLRFTDVTAASGIDARANGMGAATGDFDNDGRLDLFLAHDGLDQLLRNRGADGSGQVTFEDVTAQAGVSDPLWSAGASFVDFDRDGWLDLYVVNYVDFPVAKNPPCYAASSRRDYCGPADFPPVPDRLYRNRGKDAAGRVAFEDVSARAGIAGAAAPGPGLGVVAFDADRDGWQDLYVAEDGAPNRLWMNRRDGTFRDEAPLAGAAVNRLGRPEASMGVDAGDFDADGDEDLFMTHLDGETNTLYVNDGGGLFEDRTIESGLAQGSLPFTSFGTWWLDVDNDGWLDLFIANGAVRIQETLARTGDPFPLAQTNQLYRNLGRDAAGRVRFAEATAEAGAVFGRPAVGRGAAFGDVDEDGDTDILVCNNNGPVRLLLNQAGSRNPWLGLRLLDRHGRDALGARVEVAREGAPALWRRAHSDGSYASASDPRVLVGLGAAPRVTGVRVLWPDGSAASFPSPPLGRYTTLRQGTGKTP